MQRANPSRELETAQEAGGRDQKVRGADCRRARLAATSLPHRESGPNRTGAQLHSGQLGKPVVSHVMWYPNRKERGRRSGICRFRAII
jgi:hypothetical protein